MKRVFYDVYNKYSALCDDIKSLCKHEVYVDYEDTENYVYDFENGFVEFVKTGDSNYFANCGFLKGPHAFEQAKKALNDFVNSTKEIINKEIYAIVGSDNKKSSTLVSALGFEQKYKIYEFRG